MGRPRRFDPASSPVDGDINSQVIYAGLRPDRRYVEANPNDAYCGVSEMQRLGYEIETLREGGPHLRGGQVSADGSAVTRHGQILMSISREEYLAAEARKHAVADQRSAAIGQRGGVDRIVGPTGHVAQHAHDPSEYLERA